MDFPSLTTLGLTSDRDAIITIVSFMLVKNSPIHVIGESSEFDVVAPAIM